MRLKITTTTIIPVLGVRMCPLKLKIYSSRKLDGILWCKMMLENNGSVNTILLTEFVIRFVCFIDSIPDERLEELDGIAWVELRELVVLFKFGL